MPAASRTRIHLAGAQEDISRGSLLPSTLRVKCPSRSTPPLKLQQRHSLLSQRIMYIKKGTAHPTFLAFVDCPVGWCSATRPNEKRKREKTGCRLQENTTSIQLRSTIVEAIIIASAVCCFVDTFHGCQLGACFCRPSQVTLWRQNVIKPGRGHAMDPAAIITPMGATRTA